MWRDPIVEEIHRVRDEPARKFGYDLHAICEDIREKQATSGRKLVTRPIRWAVERWQVRSSAESD
ncbi:MAG: hypothetical protein AUI36_26930 [Cyanobacteria bacterium 13_1_40CM_2_61_4]|nr:MAG: hypothetical protein AUI36_26930 [Cyanobacteria bacterium 13_1_40CM_2_61_4]